MENIIINAISTQNRLLKYCLYIYIPWPVDLILYIVFQLFTSPVAMEGAEQPLLFPRLDGEEEQLLSRPSNITFTPGTDDIPPINSVRDFFREYLIESKKLWFLAGPAIFTSVCQYSLGAITQVFSGQVGTLALAAVSVENSVIAGFCFGVMVNL